jgi:penicillin-binding protein 2
MTLSVVLGLIILVLIGRAWSLQITRGPLFAAQSASNSLEVYTLFAPRGVITDVHGVVLAENTTRDGGDIIRAYPYPSASSLLGYVSYPKKDKKGRYYTTVETGVAGIEAEYDALLSGDNGQLLAEVDALGTVRTEGTIVPARTGEPLQLSIDIALQDALSDVLSQTATEHRFLAGGGVVLDISTGAVRALVSYPSYDSTVMSDGAPSEVIDRYSNNPGRPFLNHATQGVYAPGSIVKPLVAAGALTDGIITPNTIINDPGSISIDDPYRPGKKYVYTGWKPLGLVDVKKAIAWSSDIYFYTVGGGYKSQKGLGIDRLTYWYRSFGLGSTTGLTLSGESAGLLPTPAWKRATFNEPWYLGDTYFTAIGQYGMQVTPIQMARATAAVANGGVLVTPTLIAKTRGESVPVPVDPSVLPVVRAGMREAVASALAGALNFPYVSVAAKTGTAQTGTRNQFDNSWVIGFFPYEHPQYAFAVVLERGPAGSGSQAVNVMAKFFETLHAQNSLYVGGTATITPPQ